MRKVGIYIWTISRGIEVTLEENWVMKLCWVSHGFRGVYGDFFLSIGFFGFGWFLANDICFSKNFFLRFFDPVPFDDVYDFTFGERQAAFWVIISFYIVSKRVGDDIGVHSITLR